MSPIIYSLIITHFHPTESAPFDGHHTRHHPPLSISHACTPSRTCFHRSIQQVQNSKRQLVVLTESLAQLLKTLNDHPSLAFLQVPTKWALEDLTRLFDEISPFVEKCASESFLQHFFNKEKRQSQIQAYHRRIDSLVSLFQIAASIDTQALQDRNEQARAADQQSLLQRLNSLESNYHEMKQMLQEVLGKEILGALDQQSNQQNNALALMASLARRSQNATADGEMKFLSSTLSCLASESGQQLELEKWTISSFDVEFGSAIGSGGFGDVFKGTWGKTMVALKVLKVDSTVPSPIAIRQEVEIMLNLRHPNILAFLGANILDNRPFIVMPFQKHGNAREYIRSNPNCNRLQILHGTSKGLFYLHEQNIVHGDLKAANVLISEGEHALLCDFGLSMVKADATSRTAVQSTRAVVGSRNWMAPELLKGGSQRKACDIYSFGMTVFEIYTGETPLSNILYTDFIEMILKYEVRRERPDDETSSAMTDELWTLTARCWSQTAKERPDAGHICDTLLTFVENQPTSIPQVSVSSLNSYQHQQVSELPLPSRHAAPRQLQQLSPTSRSLPHLPLRRAPVFQELLVLNGHSGPVMCVSYSPDGQRVVSGSADHSVRIWDAQNGRQLHVLIHTSRVLAVSYSPDGQQVVSGSDSICIWDAQNGRQLHVLIGHIVARGISCHRALGYSPDGQQVVSASSEKFVRIWDAQNGRQLHVLTVHTGTVWSASYSPDGRRVVSGSSKSVCIWDAQNGRQLHVLTGHTGTCSALYSPDGRQVVSRSISDKSVRIWDAQNGRQLHVLGHSGAVMCVSYSPDGQQVASGSFDKYLRIWDAQNGRQLHVLTGHTSHVSGVLYSPDGRQVISRCNNSVCIWDAQNSRQLHVFIHTSVSGVSYSPDGQHIVLGSNDTSVRIWAQL